MNVLTKPKVPSVTTVVNLVTFPKTVTNLHLAKLPHLGNPLVVQEVVDTLLQAPLVTSVVVPTILLGIVKLVLSSVMLAVNQVTFPRIATLLLEVQMLQQRLVTTVENQAIFLGNVPLKIKLVHLIAERCCVLGDTF